MTDDKKKTKTIEIGKFYLIHDGSKTGHPIFCLHMIKRLLQSNVKRQNS